MISLKPLIYVFFGCTLLLTVYILTYKTFDNLKKVREKKWKEICDEVICFVVFNDEFNPFLLPKKVETLLSIKTFQTIITNKILFSCNNFTGKSLQNLQELYLFLKLDKYVTYHLKNKNWHIKAKAIQEIGTIKLSYLKNDILKETNHKNELVRAEAQICMIKITGYEGLNFLNNIKYPISEWHQIILLREVSRIEVKSFNNIDIWLKSKNDSVIMFSLKLVKTYHLFKLYNNTLNCLNYRNPKLRNEAIKTITSIHNKTTANFLTQKFSKEDTKNKIEILKSLKKIGSKEETPFLLSLLSNENTDIIIIAIEIILDISEDGILKITNHKFSKKEPLKSIISIL